MQATETYIKAWKPEVAAADAAHQLNPYSELAAPPAGTKFVFCCPKPCMQAFEIRFIIHVHNRPFSLPFLPAIGIFQSLAE
eukprot:1160258-Pelagomonas_calceolata.AAC.4